MRWVGLTKQKVNDIQESLEPAILERFANRYEVCGYTRCNPNGILHVKILPFISHLDDQAGTRIITYSLNTGLRSYLRVTSTV